MTGVDPLTGDVVTLFHPRRERWAEHFLLHGMRIKGITAVGRATVQGLAMNEIRRLELRAELLARGELR